MKLISLVFITTLPLIIAAQGNVGIATDTINGRLHITAQSTTSFPHLRLTETEDDYARIKFESTAFPNSFWDIAARGGTDTSGVKRFNIFFNNGVSERDLFLLQGNGDLWRNSFSDNTYDYFFTNNTYRGGLGISNQNLDLFTAPGSDGQIRLGTRNTWKLVVDTLGQVGIGTTEPDFLLDIHSANEDAPPEIEMTTPSGAHFMRLFAGRDGDPKPFLLFNNADTFRIASSGPDFSDFTEWMTVTGDGKIGLNNQEPEQDVDVDGNLFINSSKNPTLLNQVGALTLVDTSGNRLMFYQTNIQTQFGSGSLLSLQPSSGNVNLAGGTLVADRSEVTIEDRLFVKNFNGINAQPTIILRDFTTGDTDGLSIQLSNGQGGIINRTPAEDLVFGANNLVRMRLEADGDFRLLNGDLFIDNGRLYVTPQEFFEDGGDFVLELNGGLSSNIDNLDDLGSSTLRWQDIYATNGTIQTSDIREKTGVADIPYGLGAIMNLHPVKYEWKDRPEQGEKLGLVAQELIEVIPEVVKTTDWVRTEDGGVEQVELERMGVYYSDLIPVLIKAIQEQQGVIDELREENASLSEKQASILEALAAAGIQVE